MRNGTEIKKSKRILALDGGGVRGIVEIAFLSRIEAILRARAPEPATFRLCDYFDLVGGTSTGSIIAAAIATGRDAREIKALYEDIAPKVFRRDWKRIAGLQSRFASQPLEIALQRELGGMTLGDPRIRTGLALVAKRLDTGSPWIVSNIPSQPYWNDPADGSYVGNCNYSLPLLIRASTAAPYFFGPERIPITVGMEPGVFVDGAVSPYNDPSMCLMMLAGLSSFGLNWGFSRDELLLISIGAGSFRKRVSQPGNFPRPAGLFAMDALLGLIGDCQVATQTMLQWLGYSPAPWSINSEIGDLAADKIAGVPLLTYQRYDIRLEADWLKNHLDFVASDRLVEDLRRLDKSENLKLLFDLAERAAQSQVQNAHFARVFDKVGAAWLCCNEVAARTKA